MNTPYVCPNCRAYGLDKLEIYKDGMDVSEFRCEKCKHVYIKGRDDNGAIVFVEDPTGKVFGIEAYLELKKG